MKTSELTAGMIIMVDTGCVQLNNLSRSQQIVSGIHGNKMIEVSFESGLVCRFKANTEHFVVK